MADICDKTDEAEERIFALRIAHRPSAAIPCGNGRCLNCEESLLRDGEPDFERRWCDVDCRDDWEKRQARGGAA